jgi:cell wall-associated NlpC family hydrolase
VRTHARAALCAAALALAPAAAAQADPGGGVEAPDPNAPAPAPIAHASLAGDGRTALAPAGAPPQVVAAIAAANRINRKPYRYGGGHARFRDSGYDCSGTVSYVLHAAGYLRRPRASGDLMRFGRRGRGQWITVYANGGHAYMVIAGLRFDTSGPGPSGPRWRAQERSSVGYVARHPADL